MRIFQNHTGHIIMANMKGTFLLNQVPKEVISWSFFLHHLTLLKLNNVALATEEKYILDTSVVYPASFQNTIWMCWHAK